MNKFDITIGSLPDREKLVAKIYYDNYQWVEISQETDQLIIQFYPHPKKDFWEFSYDEAITVLEKAKNKFLGR